MLFKDRIENAWISTSTAFYDGVRACIQFDGNKWMMSTELRIRFNKQEINADEGEKKTSQIQKHEKQMHN